MTRAPHPHNTQWHRAQRALGLAVSLGFMTACMAPSPYESDIAAPPEDSSQTDLSQSGATYTPQPSSPEASSTSPFSFPLATCGDQSAEPSETWYSVFVDGADLNDVRSRYCGDALSTSRRSGTPTIQVASFTSYAKALSLAKAVGGVVEQTAVQATPDPNNSYQSADSSPSQPAPAPQTSAQIGQSAFLNASDASVPINIRQAASTDAEVQSTGYVGEQVQIANSAEGSDGYTWYEVQSESGATGWVRGDLITAQPPTVSSPPPEQAPAQAAPYSPQPTQRPAHPQQPYAQSPYPQQPYPQQPSPQQPYAQSPYPQQPSPQQPYAQSPYPQSPYPQQPYGQQPLPNSPGGVPAYGGGRPSQLTAREPGAAINIREYASMNSRVRYYANPGDPVQVAGSAQGDDGFLWYQVRFASGATGWVRGDLVGMN